jgi:hypothetical protein
MNIDEVVYAVRQGDAVCVPPTCYHHMINDTEARGCSPARDRRLNRGSYGGI